MKLILSEKSAALARRRRVLRNRVLQRPVELCLNAVRLFGAKFLGRPHTPAGCGRFVDVHVADD